MLSVLSFNSLGQKIVMDSVAFASPQIVCNPDTVSFFFRTGVDTSQPNLPFPPFTKPPYSNTDIHVDLPDGFRYIDIVYTESVNIGNVPAINIDGSNPNDLIFSWNGFMLNPYATLFELKLLVEPSCGANTSAASAFITRGGSTFPLSDTISTSLIQVDEPYLVFQGVSNTTNNNSSIALNRLAIGQKIRRCFKIDYTSLISSIDEITIKIDNSNQYYSFDWVTPGVTRTTVNDTVIYTFDAAFFTTIGDLDGVIEPGESLTFCDSVTVLGNCNSQNSNVKVDYVMSWGCGGFNCQSTTVAAEGVIALSPTQIITSPRPDLDIQPNLCDTCGTGKVRYGFEFYNNTKAVLSTGGFLTDLKFELGTARHPHTIASNPYLDSLNHCFDTVKINGVAVPFTQGVNAVIEISNLTSFSGTGLADIDGDGFFDDLAAGDTLVFELIGTFYANRLDTSALAYNLNGGNNDPTGTPYLIDPIRAGLDVTYYDECGGNEKEDRILSDLYVYLNPRQSSSSVTPDFFDRGSYVYTMTHSEQNLASSYECDSALRETIMILPKDVSLDTTLAYPFSTYPSNSTDSVVYWVEKDGLNDVDTLYVYYNTKGEERNGAARQSSVTLRYDCSGGICPEADSLRTIAWYQNYICINDLDVECFKTAMYRGKRLVRFHCDLPPQGISLRTFEMKRTTYGFTDSTETTKVNANTPGIALHRAQVSDTVRLTLKGVVNDAVLDSAHARFSYHTQQNQGGQKPVFRIDDVNSTVTIYDASAATYNTFRLNSPGLFSGEFGPQQAGTGTNEDYDFQWNLSSYKDSIGGGYQFTGGLLNSSTWDSIIMNIVMVVEDNSYSGDYQLDPYAQMVELPEDTATQCDIYGTLFAVNQDPLTVFARASSSFGSCISRANVVEFRTGIEDDFPNEYKRNEKINEIRFSWDPTYFNDPDSVTYTYYWRDSLGNNISGAQFVDRIAQFTQNGNSITIPMEKSANINVLPEAWHWGYVRVYQTATCAIMDSMPIAQLGIKAEMDVERFTNSSATTVVTQYDSTFSYYGNQSANILVDIPTPFNITSSPIVASTSADSVCWEVSYNNLSFTDINNTWLDFSADSIQVTSISRIDSGFNESQTILSYGTNGIWIQTDTIRSNDFKTYKVCAQYSTCQLDSIVLTGGWNCDKYPTTPTSGYAPTAYSCEHNQQTMAIYIEELEAKLQTVIVNSSTMPFNLCDTLFYDVQIANIDLTDMKDLVFSATFPSTSNLSVDPGTTSMIWSYDGINTTEITIPDPVRIGDSIAWDLTGQFSSSFLRNFESINDSNYALMKVRFNTNCVMFPNDAIKFRVEGTRGCNKRVVSRETSSEPFQVAGLKAQANRLTDIQIYLDTIQACDTATQVDLSFFNIFTKPTRGSEVLAVTLPASFDISGSIYNRHRDTLLQSVVPTNTVVGNLRTLEWLVEPGMPVAGPTGIPGADSLSFSFNIVPVTNVTCAIDTLIEAKVFERYFIFCVTDSSIPCEIIYPLDEDREAFTVTKGDLSLNSISTVLDGCTDSIDINFGFTNNGTNIANGTPTVFKIYVDVNGNGIADPTDPIFDSIVYTDSIPRGATGTINLSTSAANYTVAEICNLVVQVDSMSSCVCDTASVALPVTLNMNLKDSTLCAIDTLNLGVCSGTSYSGRTYTWYDVDGLGRESFLSNVNGLSPTFNPPAVASATTYRFAVQVNRGGCIDEDTLTIIVRSSPSMFDVVDDTICEDDCITLAIGSAQPGITYNVFDGVGSFLGTLPYLACPTNTTTYFFEAIDSAGNCSDVLDTAVITVVGKMSPGSSTTIAGCGLGCTINLYDTLGGTPDTTGTWTDPSGNPFGTGYNVTFNANTNPVGVYTYTISNMPCADTMATVTILSTIDTVPVTTLEDIPVTVGSPSIGGAGPISTITSTNGPGFGTVTTDPTSGTITYDPDSNFIGFDTVNIIVCYTAGSCDTTVLTITVLPVRDTTPVTTNEDTPFTLCPGTDSTTKVRNLGSTTVECGPNHGTIDPINQTTGCVTYTPDPNYVGVDTICIIVCDTIAGMCDTTLIPITVVPVRDTIMDTIAEGDTLTLCPPTTTDTDVLGGVSLVCGPNNGTVTFNDPTAGCVKYVPNPGFSGSDTLCIVICDVNGVCDTTTVLITIDPVTDTIPLVTLEDIPVSVGQPTLSGVTPVTVT
ncbi:MAG: Ig-like domain-containing protein, partial [Flavobacteriales bacterium]